MNNPYLARKIVSLILSLAVVFVSVPAYADQYDEQINALKSQIAQNQSAAAIANQKAEGYRGRVAALENEIDTLEAQIRVNQIEVTRLSSQINQAENQMADKKATLAENIKSMYINGNVSAVEMLMSSKNLSDYFDQQQYKESIKNSIESSIKTIAQLKTRLEADQKTMEGRLADQRGQQSQLAYQQAEVSNLLALAESDAEAADSQVASQNSQVSKLQSQQAAAIAAASRRVSGGGSGGSGCGGYPAVWCNSEQDSLTDSWGMYNRECVSYTAWYVANSGRYMPYWGGRGNAWQWAFSGWAYPNGSKAPGNVSGAHWHTANAISSNIPMDGKPRVGDVAISNVGVWGHAMIVQQINGSSVVVSNFNADNTGRYSVDEWPISALQFIHF